MKEIIVVENKAFLNKTDFVCIEDIVKDLKVEYTKEQVPENWEELKELCKTISKIETIKDNVYFIIENKIFFRGITFHLNGDIEDFKGYVISENRTPAQMWQIIKNLIGEE